jgi:hypothetical protein
MNKKLKKYSFILNYRGETYIFQINANGLKKAMKRWYQALKISEIKDALKIAKAYQATMNEYDPTPLLGLKHVWCYSTFVGKHTAEVNIVFA